MFTCSVDLKERLDLGPDFLRIRSKLCLEELGESLRFSMMLSPSI